MSDDSSIYSTYRAALRSINERKNYSKERAAARRQKARQITVERHNISYQALKAIVIEHDAKHGITHEKGSDVYRKLRFEVAVEAHQESPTPDTCPDCDREAPGNVQVRFNAKHLRNPEDEPEFVLSCYPCYFAYQGKMN